jgi:diphthamide synthase (EF-2-diphthine--ammonia ligase)
METFIVDAPFFKHRILIRRFKKIWKNMGGYIDVEEAMLQPKLL